MADLNAGVLAARDTPTRAGCLQTLTAISALEVLGVDRRAAEPWGRIRVFLFEHGRLLDVNDLWIAAIGLAHGLSVVSQDHDFDKLVDYPGFSLITV